MADYHTYFVGCKEWGFSVWAHNYGSSEGAARGRRKGGPFERLAQKHVSDVLGETVIQSQSQRGASGLGFDFLSFSGRGRKAQLYINDPKNFNGLVRRRNYSTFGIDKKRGDSPFEKALDLAEEAIRSASISKATRQELLRQLRDREATVRFFGRPRTNFAQRHLDAVVDNTGFSVITQTIRG